MKKSSIVTTLLILGISAANASQTTNLNLTGEENIKTPIEQNQSVNTQKEIAKMMRVAKAIYKLKPDLVIDYNTVCKFGGNCTQGADDYFKDIGFTNLKSAADIEVYLNKLNDKKMLVAIIPNIKRTLIMLKYAIQTETYPNTNGKMDASIFNEI